MVARTIPLPNIRKLFVPPRDHMIADCDQKGADARVVAWEAGDDDLMDAFDAGLDVHAKNMEDMGFAKPWDKTNPEYLRIKKAVHAYNYKGHPIAVAAATGWTVHFSELFQRRWFQIHPAIPNWHQRTDSEVTETRTLRNVFGYHIVYLERTENLLNEALAWRPQSTVAIITNLALIAMKREAPWAVRLLNGHDSIVFAFHKDNWRRMDEVRKALHSVVVPYTRQLKMPWEFSVSSESWGACKKMPWPA